MSVVLALAAGLAGIVAPLFAQTVADAVAPSFSKALMPIFKICCVACHMSGTEPGKMSLAPAIAYARLVRTRSTESQMARIQPFAPDRSCLRTGSH